MEGIKIVVLGIPTSGKTSMLRTHAEGKFDPEYGANVFDNYSKNVEFNFKGKKKNIVHQLWDTGGGEDYDRLRPLSYPETDIFLVVFAVDSYSTAKAACYTYIPEIKYFCPGVPFILVGAKTDSRKDSKFHSPTSIPTFIGKKIALMHEANAYFEVSAKENGEEGLKDLFDEASRLVLYPGTLVEPVMKKKKRFLIFGGGMKEVSQPMEKERDHVLSEMSKEIEKDVNDELERLRNIIKDDITSARNERKNFDGISKDVKLSILRHYILISFREGPRKFRFWNSIQQQQHNKEEEINPSHLYELRDEFYFFRDELGLTKENILLKCFGYFADDPNRQILQLFYNFQIDSKEEEFWAMGFGPNDAGSVGIRYTDYIGVKYLPKMRQSIISDSEKFYFKNFFNRSRTFEENTKIEMKIDHQQSSLFKRVEPTATNQSMIFTESEKSRLMKSQCKKAKLNFGDYFSYSRYRRIFEELNTTLPQLESLVIQFRMMGNFPRNIVPDVNASEYYSHGYAYPMDMYLNLERLVLEGEACCGNNVIRTLLNPDDGSSGRTSSLKELVLTGLKKSPFQETYHSYDIIYPKDFFILKDVGLLNTTKFFSNLQKLDLKNLCFSLSESVEIVSFVGSRQHEEIREIVLDECRFLDGSHTCWNDCESIQNQLGFLVIISENKVLSENTKFLEMLREKSRNNNNCEFGSSFRYFVSEVQGEEIRYETNIKDDGKIKKLMKKKTTRCNKHNFKLEKKKENTKHKKNY